jgi:hypothetical protein
MLLMPRFPCLITDFFLEVPSLLSSSFLFFPLLLSFSTLTLSSILFPLSYFFSLPHSLSFIAFKIQILSAGVYDVALLYDGRLFQGEKERKEWEGKRS